VPAPRYNPFDNELNELSVARRPRNAPAHPQLLLPRLIVTLGGNIAVVCFRLRSPLD
jgi:hypothetical protein